MTAEEFWLQKWPDEKKQYHWSAKGLDVLSETIAFAEAYGQASAREQMELAEQVAKEVGGRFADRHLLNTGLNKFIVRLRESFEREAGTPQETK